MKIVKFIFTKEGVETEFSSALAAYDYFEHLKEDLNEYHIRVKFSNNESSGITRIVFDYIVSKWLTLQ